MEDTLRVHLTVTNFIVSRVLILVLMEDTLRVQRCCTHTNIIFVLILVLMEDTLRAYEHHFCLNPCFNGRYSQSIRTSFFNILFICLNPCFNGRYSQRLRIWVKMMLSGLNPCFNGRYSQRDITDMGKNDVECVLILVLMEDTLRE